MTWLRWKRGKRATAALTRAEFDALPAKDRAELHNTARDSSRQFIATLLQIATTIGVLVSLLFTAQSLAQTAKSLDAAREEQKIARDGLDVTRKGQITDRFSKAVEQLGDDKMDVRIGGIYALGNIGKDATDYQQTVVDVLATYTLEHTRKPRTTDALVKDVETALRVLGRVRPANPKSGWLDLSDARIDTAVLEDAYLARAGLVAVDLRLASLENADLSEADLRGAKLNSARLTGASLARANLNIAKLPHAFLDEADLTGANLTAADLTDADFTGAKLNGANFMHAILTDATGLPPTDRLKKIVEWDAKTVWP